MARPGASEFEGTELDTSGENNGTGNAGGVIDPAALVGGSDAGTGAGDDDGFERDSNGNIKRNKDGSPRRKRGRKGGGNGASSNSAGPRKNHNDLKASIAALTNMLMLSHMGLAGVTGIPEIELEKDDAELLANATVPVLEQFDFAPDPRFVAVFGLVMATGKVYGPKVISYKMRTAAERDAKMKRAGQGSTIPDGA